MSTLTLHVNPPWGTMSQLFMWSNLIPVLAYLIKLWDTVFRGPEDPN